MLGLSDQNYCYNKMFWLSPNPFFASILQELYAGDDGKLVSFLQFSYQSFLLLPHGEKLGKLFESIATDDLLHTKKLAEAIVMLGGKPEFKTGNKYLGGRAVCTAESINAMLIANIELKEKSVINLKTAIMKIDNKFLKNLLREILNEENYHLSGLKNYYETIMPKTES